MKTLAQLVVVIFVLAGFGLLKVDYEEQIHQELLAEDLIQPPMKNLDKRELGQVSAAAVLGGMRSPIASIENLRAFVHFENLDWAKVETSYQIITALQPQTTHYWDTGAWHLHTNASVYYKENKDLSPFKQSAMRRRYIDKGSAFLEEGVRQNPDNWQLHNALARLWSDYHKLPDLKRALKHYEDTLACKSLPDYKRTQLMRFTFYTMTRVKGREKDAYTMGRELFDASDRNHTPNLVCCLFVLQNLLAVPETERIPETALFPDEKTQYAWLQNYFDHRSQDYPMDGVRAKILELGLKLNPGQN
ncbi:MAG: hypothetical protein H7A51_06930 [Akkermansiaceae bacterium]|nr:hypothetical protein [Akkermansiaceae bacterium]